MQIGSEPISSLPKPVDLSSVELAWQKHLMDNQPPLSKFTFQTDGFKKRRQFNSPNGWNFSYYSDSGGIEVGMRPMTVAHYKHFASDIQDAIFVTASNNGFFPALWRGGGHINIDLLVFRDKPLLFRNFVVDLLNHNELFMGIFNFDHRNAKPVQTHKSFAPIIAYLETINADNKVTFFEIATKLSLLTRGYVLSIDLLFADQQIVESRMASRFELRGVRPQASVDVFIRQIELLESRIKYLSKLRRPIPFHLKVPIQQVEDPYTPPVDPELALRAFYKYVTESGLQWKEHRDYLWPQWTTGGELKTFEESDWFKKRELNAECKSLLADVIPPKRWR